MTANLHVQQSQPPGVPPLSLTGERTLPDVPAENYWYRRHLAVYEWIAARVGGLRVIDMACGEGYGAAVLAQQASRVVGVDANPEAFEHARLRYHAEPNLSFERAMVERYGEPDACDVVTFLQTIEHVQNPEAVLRHFKTLLAPGGVVYVSTPNLLTLAPVGCREVQQSVAREGVPRARVPLAVRVGVRVGRALMASTTRANSRSMRSRWRSAGIGFISACI